MDRTGPLIRNISDTAFWTAALRAGESERPDAVFCDPYARRLAGERGFEIVRAIKMPAVRFGVVLRTAAIDEIVTAAAESGRCDTILSLACGLDARPWRMELPAELRWIDVDMPDLLGYKDSILGDEEPRCVHDQVPLDLADRAARIELFERIGGESRHALILTEGLLSYLEPDAVGLLADDLHTQTSFAEWVTDITGANVLRHVKGAGDKLRPNDAKTRFAPEENTAFFEPHGWCEAEFVDLFWEAPRLGRDSLFGRALRGVARLAPDKAHSIGSRGLGIARLQRT